MNQINNFLMCKFKGCNKYYMLPIKLPCDKSLCKEHIEKLKSQNSNNKFKCQFCQSEHDIPNEGFKINQDIINVLDMNLHLSPTQLKLSKSINELESVAKNMKSISKDTFVHDYLSNLRNDIKKHRDFVKSQINNISNMLLKQVDEFENDCKKDKPSLNESLLDIKKETKRLENELGNYRNEIRNPDLNDEKCNKFINDIESEVSKNGENVIKIRDILMNNKVISFEKKLFNFESNDFGVINLKITHTKNECQTSSNKSNQEEKLDKVISPRIITSPHSASTRPMLIQEKIEKIASPVSTEETLNEEKTDEAETDKILISQILYYIREGYFQKASKYISKGLKQYLNSPILKYYNGICLVLESKYNEAIEEFKKIRKMSDVGYGSKVALFFIHKKTKEIDESDEIKLKLKIEQDFKKSKEKGLYYAAYFYYCVSENEKALDLVNEALSINQKHIETLSLRGWIEIKQNSSRAVKFFRLSSGIDHEFIDSIIGESKSIELDNKFSLAIEHLNKYIKQFPNMVCLLIEKMKLELSVQEWKRCFETSQRAITLDNDCLEAYRYRIFETLCQQGNYEEAADQIKILYELLVKNEPYNHDLFYDFGKIFARLCGSDSNVLKYTEKYIEKALSLDSNNINYICELGSHKFRQGKVSDAFKHYARANNLDRNNLNGILGKIKCEILMDNFKNSSPFELIEKDFPEVDSISEYCYIKSIYNKRLKLDDQNVKLISGALLNHTKQIQGLPLGKKYFYVLNPDFMIYLIKEYIKLAPYDETNETISPIIKKCKLILDTLKKIVPGMVQAKYYLAKIHFLLGNIEEAIDYAQDILEKYQDAHILMAEIYLYKQDLNSSIESLKFGLSCFAQIENNPNYHQIKALISIMEKNYQEALVSAKLVLEKLNFYANDFSIHEKANFYLQLSELYYSNQLLEDAKQTILEAEDFFKGTIEEKRIFESEIKSKIFKNYTSTN